MRFRTEALASQQRLARYARAHYNPRLVGGEGHLEVAKHIHAAVHRQAHMVVSIKPFGCLPSTQSDGVQSRVLVELPDSIFIPIETSGDGEVGVHSRLQMKLYEAKARAREEMRRVLDAHGLSLARVHTLAGERVHLQRALQWLPHRHVGTAANFAEKVARQL